MLCLIYLKKIHTFHIPNIYSLHYCMALFCSNSHRFRIYRRWPDGEGCRLTPLSEFSPATESISDSFDWSCQVAQWYPLLGRNGTCLMHALVSFPSAAGLVGVPERTCWARCLHLCVSGTSRLDSLFGTKCRKRKSLGFKTLDKIPNGQKQGDLNQEEHTERYSKTRQEGKKYILIIKEADLSEYYELNTHYSRSLVILWIIRSLCPEQSNILTYFSSSLYCP